MLARRGYDLIILARNHERLDALAKRITNDTGRSVEVLVADLSNKNDLARVETAAKQDSSITMLVNNASVGSCAPLLDNDIGKIQETITLNITALTRLAYAVAPGLVARGAGTIINIASIVAIAPELLNGGSKAYLLAFRQCCPAHRQPNSGILPGFR